MRLLCFLIHKLPLNHSGYWNKESLSLTLTVLLGAGTFPSLSWRSKIACDANVIITVTLFIFNIFPLTDLFLFKSEIFLLRKKYIAPLYFLILKITRCQAVNIRKLKTSEGDLKNHKGGELWYSGLGNFIVAAWFVKNEKWVFYY